MPVSEIGHYCSLPYSWKRGYIKCHECGQWWKWGGEGYPPQRQRPFVEMTKHLPFDDVWLERQFKTLLPEVTLKRERIKCYRCDKRRMCYGYAWFGAPGVMVYLCSEHQWRWQPSGTGLH